MSSTGPTATASATAPTWSNTSGPSRPAVEDHRGTADGGMDELLAPVSTLDEPVRETIMRDVRAVGAKLRAVLIPLDRNVSSNLFAMIAAKIAQLKLNPTEINTLIKLCLLVTKTKRVHLDMLEFCRKKM